MKSITTFLFFFLYSGFSCFAQFWLGSNETLIDQNYFGFQTERSVPRYIVNSGNDSLEATWSASSLPSWNTVRGSAYCSIGPLGYQQAFPYVQSRFSSYTSIDAIGGNEYIIATTPDSGVILSKRQLGTSPWITYFPVGSWNIYPGQQDEWSRMAVGGTNNETVHIIVNSQGKSSVPVLNQNGPLTYSRSLDGGITWGIDHIRLPQSDENYFRGFNRGNYAIDCRGNTVAVVAGGFDADLCLWKSVDNGTTWNKTVIFPFPVPLYNADSMLLDPNSDGIPDTVETSGQDPTVIVDVNGVVHVAFGRMLIYDSTIVGKDIYDPLADGLYYWNESMGSPAIVANTVDQNGNGIIDLPVPISPNPLPVSAHFGGLIIQPSLASSINGELFLSYAAVNELADTNVFQCAHRHIYIIASLDMGISWVPEHNVVPQAIDGGDGEFQEAAFGSLAKNVDYVLGLYKVNMIYFRDLAPYCVDELNAASPFYTQELWNEDGSGIPYPIDVFHVSGLFYVAGLNENNESGLKSYPNPARKMISVSGFKSSKSTASLRIYNSSGNLIQSSKASIANNQLTANVSALAEGPYVLQIITDNQVSCIRFIKN